ncbi:MAG: type II secretion system F family protein, partial [Gammaproteobacteria bacterium]
MAAKAIKNTLFLWEGSDRRGARVKGEARASNPAMVKADLRRQGIKPLKVRKKGQPLFGGKKKVTAKDIAIFSRQLATMIAAGVPLVQAFEIVGRGHENPGMQELIMAIKADVEGGGNLTDALSKHPRHFDGLFCNLVRAGEHAGILDSLLDKIATYKEKTEALKGKIKKALFYPTAVVIAAIIVTTIMLLFVVPTFQSLFKSFGADLPAFTQMVINLSEWLQKWWWVALIGIAGAAAGFVQAKRRSKRFRELLDRMVLKIPIIGDILNKASIARYCRTLATMFAAGVPLVEAMESVAGATGNSVYANAVLQMRENVATGQQLQIAMQQVGLFPNMVVQMVAIGEES